MPIVEGKSLKEPLIDQHGQKDANINDHDEEGGHGPKTPFVKSHGLTSAEAEALFLIHGRNELEEKTTPKYVIFFSQLIEVSSSSVTN
jgi:hypothetical protein